MSNIGERRVQTPEFGGSGREGRKVVRNRGLEGWGRALNAMFECRVKKRRRIYLMCASESLRIFIQAL